jgi:N-methylhydantoinase B
MRFPAWGVAGGLPGARMQAIYNDGRPDERRLGKIHELHMRKGDTITLHLPGGGGWGDPMQRDPARVRDDVLRGFVTPEGAARDYGVVIANETIDVAATRALRQSRAHEAASRGWFGFGIDRERWEAVFTDAAMDELNRHLYALPKAVRQDVRARVFEAAVPGIVAGGGKPISELIPDTRAASARLRAALAALVA